ncbi:transcription initiation factor TFIID subunit 10, putative [Plasmodium sp. gorilla clade G3]|nr:transcription initiation factor TFIID subunit 10, putative [Plasmodium sp. gorilla clade G3]
MDKNFVNEHDEQLIKTLLKNKPTFSEDLIDFYLSQSGCQINEKSCLRLISLVLHKSIDNIINKTISLQANESLNNEGNKKSFKNELNYKELVEALKQLDDTYENEELFKNFNVFLE